MCATKARLFSFSCFVFIAKAMWKETGDYHELENKSNNR